MPNKITTEFNLAAGGLVMISCLFPKLIGAKSASSLSFCAANRSLRSGSHKHINSLNSFTGPYTVVFEAGLDKECEL